jgi:5-methyltetrahydropteroyltriglutamate--homocysteine methyltransferase
LSFPRKGLQNLDLSGREQRGVMGFVSTKTSALENEDDVLRRMDEAASFLGGDVDRLAISPQWGFASVMVGNQIDEDTQWRKLELVARVADRLWH